MIFDFLILLLFIFLVLAQTGNRIIIICVHNEKLPVIFVSQALTIIEVGCLHNFSINQRFKKIKYFDSFDYLIIFWLICFRSCMTKKGKPSTEKSKISNNQIWFFWFFDYFDVLIYFWFSNFWFFYFEVLILIPAQIIKLLVYAYIMINF